MTEQPQFDVKFPDPEELTRNLIDIAGSSRKLVLDFLHRQMTSPGRQRVDPLNVGGAFLEMTARLMADPSKIMTAQLEFWQRHMDLWHSASQRLLGREAKPAHEPAHDDRRFKHADWDENLVYDYIKQSYLLTAGWLQQTVGNVDGLDRKTRDKVGFYTRQFVDAMAPSNFLVTNPEVLRATIESSGQNLVKGLGNMLADLERGEGKLHIRMTDASAFEIGENVAITPGKVVAQTDLMQLLQYAPTTKTVHQRPLLIVPPWINKYYILDLKPENSFVRWAVAQGFTVFIVSWVNPSAELAHKSFEDYMREGILAAVDAIEKTLDESEITVIGYCLGGTLMAATLAYMAAKKDTRVKAATFFAAQVDFSEAGELSVFIDEEQLRYLDELMNERGYLDGGEMAATFNLLRANDLIWSFVVRNYLLGKDPFPFDLLFWNSDSTRMPAAMHRFYLRKMYQENLLAQPGGITLNGVPIDIGKIKIPVYLQAAKDDHIAPYGSVYKATRQFSGPVRFMLAGSGHIAGVVNPPQDKKYQHWTNPARDNPPTSEEWLEGATEHTGSWWPDWKDWLAKQSGPQVPARDPAKGKLKPIADAPGSYVKVRFSEPKKT
jgi:polyhydroxyalkanoate synthase subunit PhaC